MCAWERESWGERRRDGERKREMGRDGEREGENAGYQCVRGFESQGLVCYKNIECYLCVNEPA